MTCDECSGNGGWYTAANGERHLSDPGDVMAETWQRCPDCNGTGILPDEEQT